MKELKIKNEELATVIANTFIDKYFRGIDYDQDVYFIGNELSCFNTVGVGDYFFDISTMYQYLECKYPIKKMFEHYWYALDCYEKGESPINIKNYLKIKK